MNMIAMTMDIVQSVMEQMEIIIQDACMREQVAVGIVLPVEIMACKQEAQYSLPKSVTY